MQLANCATLHGSILNCNEGLPRAATVTPRKKKKVEHLVGGWWWWWGSMGWDGEKVADRFLGSNIFFSFFFFLNISCSSALLTASFTNQIAMSQAVTLATVAPTPSVISIKNRILHMARRICRLIVMGCQNSKCCGSGGRGLVGGWMKQGVGGDRGRAGGSK